MTRKLRCLTMGTAIALACLSITYPVRAGRSPEQVLAKQILGATGVQGGLVVHVGCGDGKLTAALRASNRYLVHGLEADSEKVERARDHVQSLGLYGKVTIEQWTDGQLPYVDNLVNLLVVTSPGEVDADEATRALVPNGVAYVRKDGKWTKTTKPRPGNIDEWTHALHDTDNNAVARDDVVGPPRHLQWVADPKWARSHDHLSSVSAVVSSGGRIFSIVDEAPAAFVALPSEWRLVARDAFNGVLLWKRPIGPWEAHLRGFRSGPPHISRRLVAVGDRVYVTLGYGEPVTALDAATGETNKTYEGTEGTLEILCHDGALFVVAGDRAAEQAADVAWRRGVTPAPHNKRILALDADTGRKLWNKSDPDTAEVMPTTLAVQGGRVFFQNPDRVICLDGTSGDEIWRAERPVARKRLGWSAPTLVVHDDVVLSADRANVPAKGMSAENPDQVEWDPNSGGGKAPVGELIAFSVETGHRLWACEARECYNAPVDVLVAGGLVWTGDLVKSSDPGITKARNPRTGKVERTRPADQESFRVGMAHHRCYRNKATDRYLVLGRAGVEWIDTTSGRAIVDHWVRGACQYGVMPCNGLLYAPSHSCACYIQAKLNGFNALAAKRESRPGRDQDDRRLERGSAYSKTTASSEITASDWPTYRCDPARSGHTESAVPSTIEPAWSADIGGKLSSPVIATGRAFVSAIDAYTVHALDADSGKPVWSYTVGGRVDSPPTIHKGLALFGSADGWVYCLRASDGQLVWRFRAAPEDRRIVAYGRLESVWPVHGNVLVQNDVAYFAAGRSSFLDGGIYLYRLDPQTGERLSETGIDNRDPRTGQEPQEIIRRFNMQGALPDVLSSDGQSVYMRHRRFDLDGVEQEPDVAHLFSPAGFLDGSWWHRTYWMVGTSMGSGYGGWPRVGNTVPAGRLLTFDDAAIYGFGRCQYAHHGSHVGLDASTVFHFNSKRDAATRTTSYHLFSMSRNSEPPAQAPAKPARKPGAQLGTAANPAKTYLWSKQVPLLVRAMVSSGDRLLMAGPPDMFPKGGSAGADENVQGGLLLAVSTSDGGDAARYPLDSPPVFDGMAVANGRLYLSTESGEVLCFAAKAD